MNDIKEEIWVNISQGLELEPNNNIGSDTTSENAILFYVEYLILKQKLGYLTQKDVDTFEQIVKNLRTWVDYSQLDGLFDRKQDESLTHHPRHLLRIISHDNITAISAFSSRLDLEWARNIAKHALKNLFRMDNGQPKKPRWLFKNKKHEWDTSFQWHPRDWFFWLYSARGFYRVLSYPLYPLFFTAQVLSYRNPPDITSTKLLGFVRCYNVPKRDILLRFCWFFCVKLLKNQYGNNYISSLMKVYFKNKEHPNRILAQEVENG